MMTDSNPYTVLIEDLMSRQLKVDLVPGREPRKWVRIVEEQNPGWYRRLCAAYPVRTHKKKPSTIIKRRDILRILKRLEQGLPTRSHYAKDLTVIAMTYDPEKDW